MLTHEDLTVVIASHNGADFIEEQIDSIVRQTFRPKCVIVADDASKDGTAALVRKWIAKTSEERHGVEFELLESGPGEPLGTSRNLARAACRVRTGFVALSDQDDVWLPQKLEVLSSLFTDDVSLVASDATLVDERLRPLGATMFSALGVSRRRQRQLRGPEAIQVLIGGNVCPGMTMMMRTDLLHRADSVPDGWVHDHWLALFAAAEGGFRAVCEPLVLYRQHGSNQVGVAEVRSLEAVARTMAAAVVRRPLRTRPKRVPDWLALQSLVVSTSTTASARSLLMGKIRFEERRAGEISTRRVILDALGGNYGKFRRSGLLDAFKELRPRGY